MIQANFNLALSTVDGWHRRLWDCRGRQWEGLFIFIWRSLLFTEGLRKLSAPNFMVHWGCLSFLTEVLNSRKLPWRCLEAFGRDLPKGLPPLISLSFTLQPHHSLLQLGFLPGNIRGLLVWYRSFLLQIESTLGRFEDVSILNPGNHTLRVLNHSLVI